MSIAGAKILTEQIGVGIIGEGAAPIGQRITGSIAGTIEVLNAAGSGGSPADHVLGSHGECLVHIGIHAGSYATVIDPLGKIDEMLILVDQSAVATVNI